MHAPYKLNSRHHHHHHYTCVTLLIKVSERDKQKKKQINKEINKQTTNEEQLKNTFLKEQPCFQSYLFGVSIQRYIISTYQIEIF